MLRDTRTGLHYESWVMCGLAMAHTFGGDPEAAVEIAQTAVELAERRHTMSIELEARIALVRALLAAHGAEAAGRIHTVLDRATELVRLSGAHVYRPWIEWTLGELAHAQGEPDAAEQHLLQARECFRETGAHGWAERVAEQVASLYA